MGVVDRTDPLDTYTMVRREWPAETSVWATFFSARSASRARASCSFESGKVILLEFERPNASRPNPIAPRAWSIAFSSKT
jgi:hypothetical protein